MTVFILWLKLNEVTHISTEHDNSSKRWSQEQSNHKTGLKYKIDVWHDLQSLFCVYLFIKDDFTLSNVMHIQTQNKDFYTFMLTMITTTKSEGCVDLVEVCSGIWLIPHF